MTMPSAPPSLDKAIDLKHYLRVLLRRKGIILLCAILCFASTLVALEFVPKTYESQVTMMIEDSQLLSSELEKVRGGILESRQYYGLDEERMAKLMGRVRSRPFLERVIRILRMHEDPMIRAKALDEMRSQEGDVTVEEMAIRILVDNLQSRLRFGSSGSGVYKITVADYSAENAQLLARWISEIFVDTSNQRNLDLIKSSHEFGAEQLRIYEQRLATSEDLLERYKASLIKRDLTRAILPAGNLGFAEALARKIGDDAALTRVRLKEYTEAVDRLDLSNDPESILLHPRVRELSEALTSTLGNDVMNSLGSAANDLDSWPPPGSAALRRNLFREIEAEVDTQFPDLDDQGRGTAANFLFAKLDLHAQESAADVLESSIGISKARVESTPSGEIELSRLEGEVETNRRLLQSFQSQMVASDVSRAVEVTKLGMQIEILDPATRPLKPSHPNRRKILLASLLLGPMIGAGMAFLGEATDSTLRTLDDFARVVPEPILGATPLLSRLTVRRRWMRRHWVAVSVGAVVLLAVTVYAARGPLRLYVLKQGTPVQMVNPEKGADANQR